MKPNIDLKLTQTQRTILSSLRCHERFGLEILDAIEGCGGKRLGFAALYPNLKKLEEKGFVTSRWEDAPAEDNKSRRKYFRITGLGAQALEQREGFLSSLAQWQPGLPGLNII